MNPSTGLRTGLGAKYFLPANHLNKFDVVSYC
jgi:hypothetical protein